MSQPRAGAGRRRRLLVGSYGPPTGRGQGITVLEHDPADGALRSLGVVAETESPSFLALSPDRPIVYAVNERTDGSVAAFRWQGSPDFGDRSPLEALGSRSTEGAAPCHLVVHPGGRYLLTANYSSGSVAVHRLAEDGKIGPLTEVRGLSGRGPDAERQKSAHAHMVAIHPVSGEIALADLGSDRVWRFALDLTTGRLSGVRPALSLPAGSGTRQVVFLDGGRRAATLGELDGSVGVATWPPRGEEPARSRPAFTAALPAVNLAAALTVSSDGRRLYCSHRGADRITVLDLAGGEVTVSAEFSAAGSWPRHIGLVDNQLYVANQRSDSVAAITLSGDGLRATTATTCLVPSPACVLASPGSR